LDRIIKAGYQLSPDAFENLQKISLKQAESLIQQAIIKANNAPKDTFILDWSFFESVTNEQKHRDRDILRGKIPLRKRIDPYFTILYPDDPSPESDINGFTHYFQSRYNQLVSILRKRADVKDAISLTNALKLPLNSKFKTFGLVKDKRSKGNRLFLSLEDMTSQATVMASGIQTVRKGLEILNDQVICFEGIKYRDDLFIANDFIWPDIPMHEIKRAEKPVHAVFIADIHIGSKYFRFDLFDKFIKWMNLEFGNIRARELASRIKYVVINGDLVDGVGIFPNQLDELDISEQITQYEKAADLLNELPDFIEIFILPGNHDAVRRSLPQPPIPKKYAPRLYEDKRIHMLPNPCLLNLHDVEVFAFHGAALTDILSSTPGHDFKNPVKALELLVRCRHIAPIYGQTTPIAPETSDRLIITSVPDVILAAHIHINATKRYKGVTLVSTGGFQDQTPFQKRMNINPSPGIVSVFNLQNHQLVELDIKKMS
jgi:DNA polymerase II small subunit